MKILNYVELIDSVRSNRTELYTKKHKNNQKIRKSSGTVRRDKIELVRLSSVRFDSVRFENLLKFDSFTVMNFELQIINFGRLFSLKVLYIL
jgi:hypothetical protein